MKYFRYVLFFIIIFYPRQGERRFRWFLPKKFDLKRSAIFVSQVSNSTQGVEETPNQSTATKRKQSCGAARGERKLREPPKCFLFVFTKKMYKRRNRKFQIVLTSSSVHALCTEPIKYHYLGYLVHSGYFRVRSAEHWNRNPFYSVRQTLMSVLGLNTSKRMREKNEWSVNSCHSSRIQNEQREILKSPNLDLFHYQF